MSNRQVAILCACIVLACSGWRYADEFVGSRGRSVWDIAIRIQKWLDG